MAAVADVGAYVRSFLTPLGVDEAVCEYVAAVVADAAGDTAAAGEARDTVAELLDSCVETPVGDIAALLPRGTCGASDVASTGLGVPAVPRPALIVRALPRVLSHGQAAQPPTVAQAT